MCHKHRISQAVITQWYTMQFLDCSTYHKIQYSIWFDVLTVPIKSIYMCTCTCIFKQSIPLIFTCLIASCKSTLFRISSGICLTTLLIFVPTSEKKLMKHSLAMSLLKEGNKNRWLQSKPLSFDRKSTYVTKKNNTTQELLQKLG